MANKFKSAGIEVTNLLTSSEAHQAMAEIGDAVVDTELIEGLVLPGFTHRQGVCLSDQQF